MLSSRAPNTGPSLDIRLGSVTVTVTATVAIDREALLGAQQVIFTLVEN
jgi:hypothetical protein